MENTVGRIDRDATRVWAVTASQALAGAYFVVAGLLKIIAAPVMVAAFARWGWPASTRVAFGMLELACGVLLVMPRFARAAAWTLAGVMAWSAVVRVASLEAPVWLIEPLMLTPLLLVVANAFSPGGASEDLEASSGPRPRGHREGGLHMPEMIAHPIRWTKKHRPGRRRHDR